MPHRIRRLSREVRLVMGPASALFRKLWRFLGSLKLAVFVILAVATISAVGTFVEASYNSEVAQKWVYYSPWMKGVLLFMAINLIVSALHRWPWKKHQTGFVVAHVGILMVMVGSLLTGRYGVDGSLFFEIGEKRRTISVNDYELILYVSDEFQFFPMYSQAVDFLVEHPKKYPVEFKYQNDNFKITDYIPFAIAKTEVMPIAIDRPDTPAGNPALRFQISNDRVNVTDWLQQPSSQRPGIMALGPATLILASGAYTPTGGNEIILRPLQAAPKHAKTVDYEVHYRDTAKKIKKGQMKVGDVIDTGWMGLQFRLLNFYPKAVVSTHFTALDRPTPLTTQAVEVDFNGKKHWLGLNGVLKLFNDKGAYILTYGNKQLNMGFEMTLKNFEVGRYQGTMRASSYKSLVEVPGLGEREISMNEPLKHNGYTFYQASFQEDPNTGKPTASIISVNYDPGRILKYLGTALIVLGALLMFYLGGYFKTTPRESR